MANPNCSICKGEGVFYEYSTVETCWCSLPSQIKAERDVLAELEAYKKDAERYRWLRQKQTFIWLIQDWFPDGNDITDVDAAIDAAMELKP